MRTARVLAAICGAAFALAAQQSGFDAYFRAGLTALNQNNLAAAQANLEAASKLQPGNARVWLALAQTYWKLRKPVLSGKAAAEAEKLGAADAVVLHGLAIYYSGRNDPAKAAGSEARYAAKAPEDAQAVPRAMALYLEAGQPKQAVELGLKTPGWERRAGIRNLLGKAYDADRQYVKAIPELQEAIRLEPREEAHYFDLGFVLLKHHNFDVAIQVLEASTKLFDKSPQLELALGVAHYGQGHFPEAVDCFLKTISLDPSVEQPYLFLGRIIERANERLVEIIQRFVEFQRNWPQSHLGYFLHAKALNSHLEDPELAETLLRKSIALNASFWESHYQLATLLEKRNLLEAAAKEYEASARLNRAASLPHYRLAQVLFRLERKEQAKTERALYQKLAAEERAALEKRLSQTARLELVVE